MIPIEPTDLPEPPAWLTIEKRIADSGSRTKVDTVVVWNTVRADLSTHEVGGLSNIDVELAKKINGLRQ